MSRWKMSAPDHAFMPTIGVCMAKDRHVQPEHRCLTNEGLLANSLHYLATANVLIFAKTLNPRFLKPALYFNFDKAGGRKSIIDQRQGLSLPVQGYPTRAGYISSHGTVLYYH